MFQKFSRGATFAILAKKCRIAKGFLAKVSSFKVFQALALAQCLNDISITMWDFPTFSLKERFSFSNLSTFS